ncbi:MAG: glycosyltransferase involved in cell wall biosynthesis [Bacteroidia bacterium]|jgi:glycosyltransferase involved in cell wall biosynthesis
MAAPTNEPLHVLHVFATFVPAGPQTRTAGVLAALGTAWRHTIVAMDNRTTASEILADELDVTIRDCPPKAGLFKTLRALRGMIEELQPDLVCTYNWGSIETVMAVRSLTGVPLIHHEEGFGPEEASTFFKRRIWMRRFLLKRVPALVVPSHNLGDIARKLWKVPERQLHVVANGVDLDRFGPGGGNLRGELGIPSTAVVVGSVGHLRPEKNYSRLLEAFAEAKQSCAEDLHLVLVGDGVCRDELEQLGRGQGISDCLHFAGHREDTADSYRTFDIFCLSSDTEQMPISLVEAMATGVAPTGTDVGDIKLMVPQESILDIVPKTDCPSALAERIAALAEDPEERRRKGLAAQKRANELYGFEAMLEVYKGLYEGLIF